MYESTWQVAGESEAARSSQVPGDVAVTGSGCVTYVGCRDHFASEGQPKKTFSIRLLIYSGVNRNPSTWTFNCFSSYFEATMSMLKISALIGIDDGRLAKLRKGQAEQTENRVSFLMTEAVSKWDTGRIVRRKFCCLFLRRFPHDRHLSFMQALFDGRLCFLFLKLSLKSPIRVMIVLAKEKMGLHWRH